MKKYLLALLLLLPAFAMRADHHDLVIHLKNGTTEVYALADNPRITFSDTHATISTNSASSSYRLEEFSHFRTTPEGEMTSIMDVSSIGLIVKRISDSVYEISGNSVRGVRIFDTSGLLLSDTSAGESPVIVDLGSFQSGIYLLSIDMESKQQTVKLTKN